MLGFILLRISLNGTMDSNDQTNQMPSDDDLNPEAPPASKKTLVQAKLSDSVKSTGRIVWTAIGVMATLGGVLGLYQFFQPSQPNTRDATGTLLVAMVAEGVITSEQAENLSNALIEPSVEITVEETVSLKAALDEQDKDAIVAMAKMLTRANYEEGLNLLEASAETADDWLELARLSWGRDRERSLRAAEKAVALDPDNFQAITFLIQAQAAFGDYKKATRSADIADMLASTPSERLGASAARLNTYILARDAVAVEDMLGDLQAEMDNFVPIAEAAAVPDHLSADKFSDHPVWILSSAETAKATALLALEDYETSAQAINTANELLGRFQTHIDGAIAANVKTREIGNLELLAKAFAAQNKQQDAYDTHEKILAKWTELAEAGNASANEALPLAWAAYGQTAYQFGEKEKARILYGNGQELVIQVLKDNPDNEEWQITAEYYESLMLYLAQDEAPEAYKDSYRSRLQTVQQSLVGTPKDDELRRELLTYTTTYSSALLFDLDQNRAELDWLIGYLRETSGQLAENLGANYFSSLLEYSAEYIGARVDEQTEDLSAARVHYQNMLNLYDVLMATPDVQSFDPEKFGTELYGFKLGTLYKLASFKDEYSLQYAQQGLSLSQQLDRAGQLRTADQYYLKTFSDFVSELESHK